MNTQTSTQDNTIGLSINLRGTWQLNVLNDDCPICQSNVSDICVECSTLTSNINCISIMGVCSHVYHLHCIERWTKTKNVCPLDNTKWEFKKPMLCKPVSNTIYNSV